MNKKNVINKNKILISFLFGFMVISSCKDLACDGIMIKLDSLACNGEICELDLKELFDEDWDELFIFHGFNTSKDISNVIGFEYEGEAIYDHKRLVLEIANGKILNETRTECLNLNLDRVLKNGHFTKKKEESIVTLSISGDSTNKTYAITD